MRREQVVAVALAGFLVACSQGVTDEGVATDPRPLPEPVQVVQAWSIQATVDRMTDKTHHRLEAAGIADQLTVSIDCPVRGRLTPRLLLPVHFFATRGSLHTESDDAIYVSTRFDHDKARIMERWDGSRYAATVPFDRAAEFLSSMRKHDRLLVTIHQTIGDRREETFDLTGFEDQWRVFLAKCPASCVGFQEPGDRDHDCPQVTMEEIAEALPESS